MPINTDKPLCAVVFSVGSDHYALPAAELIEVLPLVTLRQLPQMPAWVAGLLNYRGTAVVVVDISCLMIGKPCQAVVSTRILLTPVQRRDGTRKILGLMAESVIGTVKILPETLRTTGIWNESAPYLGMLAMHEGEILQIIHPDRVLTGESRTLLELED